jgi:exopolyphosphatase/guanosine-5'-triphosphate,3'-diphosphate pyrophosphatase
MLPPLAAIDVGSNAIRLLIAKPTKKNLCQVLLDERYPLRLGEDAFKNKAITTEKIHQLHVIFSNMIKLMKLHQVISYRACATSALRNAINGTEITTQIFNSTGLQLEIITGNEEARLIHMSLISSIKVPTSDFIIFDLGGGSMEWIWCHNHNIHFETSYDLGALKLLNLSPPQQQQMILDFQHDLAKNHRHIQSHLAFNEKPKLYGTGGNLRRLGKLRKKIFQLSPKRVYHWEILEMMNILEKMPQDQKMQLFDMRSDRADIIVPAMSIIHHALEILQIEEIHLPEIGLKEGIYYSQLAKINNFN